MEALSMAGRLGPLACRGLAIWVLVALIGLQGAAAQVLKRADVPRALQPRPPLDAGSLRLPGPGFQGGLGQRLTLKLVDGVRGRAKPSGELVSRVSADLTALAELATAEGLRFEPLVRLPEQKLADLERRAARRSGREQPDLAAMLSVDLPSDEAADLLRVGEALRALPQVEYVFVQVLGSPPPGDIAPVTPDLFPNQGYHQPEPGLNAAAAWAQNLRGAGVRVSDCEYGWNPAHEDLVDKDTHPEPGQTIHPSVYSFGWDDHGTAVLGELSAPDNGYGVSGLCPDAELATYTEWSVEEGFRRVAAITDAIADSEAGDVVLLEMQTTAFGGGGFGPAELDPSVWAVCRAGVDAGVVVVGAAGNGNQDLDSATYATYAGWGDSGAVLVGAGSADAGHHKLSFSTFGSRVNVQGWGENVFTLGYGSFASYGGDPNQDYTDGFGGTSSASPFAAASCVLLQQRSAGLNQAPLPPGTLRQILMDTGTPQGNGGAIGPLPELASALAAVVSFDPDPWVDLGAALAGTNGPSAQLGSGTLLAASPFGIDLSGGPSLGSAFWILGLSNLSAPFKGGTLVPAPDAVVGPFVLDPLGGLVLGGSFPAGVPAGVPFYSQFWMPDAGAVKGYSASNALQGSSQ